MDDTRVVVMNDNLELFWYPADFYGDFSIVEVDAEEWQEHCDDIWDLDKCVAMLKAAIEAGKSTEVDV